MTRTLRPRFTVFFVLLLASTAVCFAQQTLLLNDTGALLYVRALASSDQAASYRQIPIDGALPYEEGTDLVGFAYIRGSFQLPTLSLPGDQLASLASISERGVATIRLENGILSAESSVSPDTVSDVISGVRIDNHYLDWVGLSPRFARARGAAPIGVYADFGSGRETIDLGDALLWQRAGTNIEWVKTSSQGEDLFLAISSYSSFGAATSVFLYLYAERASIPVATIELPAGARRGLVFLWIPGEIEPIVAGNLTVSEFFLEAQIWRSALDGVLGDFGEDSRISVEISTGSSAAGVWEEYVLARDSFEELFGP